MRRTLIFVVIFLTCTTTAALFWFFTNDDGITEKQYRDAFRRNYKIFAVEVPDKLDFAGEEVPLKTFYVHESLDKELLVNTYWHNSTLQTFKRAHRWFPVIEPILAEYGIPDDFKYLAVIESGLLQAVSSSGAAGFWQFLKGTAKDYDLEVDKDVDERYHVQKSTAAACRYLQDSYKRFGNWTLVASAYNAGNRRISESLEKQNQTSYYDLFLNQETTRYVYRILALKTLFEHPTSYGFYMREMDFYPPVPGTTVTVDKDIKDLVTFAGKQNIPYKVLKIFNPWLRDTKLSVKKGRSYQIFIPNEEYLDYEALIEEMNDDDVVFGDTLNFKEL